MRNVGKKISCVLLAVMLAIAAFLAGCSSNEGASVAGDSGSQDSGGKDSGKKVKITMSVWGMPWEDALYKDIYIPEFEKLHPDIDVEFVNYTNYSDKLVTLAAGGNAPDVMRQNTADVPLYISKDMNLELDKFIERDGIDRSDYVDAVWKAVTKEGKTYAMPQDENLHALYYDPKAFAEAGIPEPDHNYTLAQLLEDAKKLTKKNGDQVERYGFVTGWNAWNFINYVLAFGGSLWSEDKQTSTIGGEGAVKALEYWKSLMVDFNLTPYQSEMGQLGPDVYFQTGKAAMYMDGTWMAPSITKAAPDFKFKATSFPAGTRKVVRGSSCTFAIYKNTKHPEAAWELTKFLTSKEALTKYWQVLWVAAPASYSATNSESFKNVSGYKGDIPGIKSEEEYKDKVSWIVDTFNNKWDTQEWIGTYQSLYWTEVDNAIQSVLVEGSTVSPADALKKAEEAINQNIKNQQLQ